MLAQYTSTQVVGGVAVGTPAFFQNFELNATLNTWPVSAQSTAQSYSPTHSGRIDITAASTAPGGAANALSTSVQPTQGDEVWFRVRTFFPLGFDFTASPHLKFLRIDTGTVAGSGHGSHIDWYVRSGGPSAVGYFDFILEGVASWLYGGGSPTPLPTGIIRGQWQTWEVYYKLHSNAANAIIRMWRDGTLICDTSAGIPATTPTRATLNASTDIIGGNNGLAGGFMHVTYWNGGSPATQSWYIDDFTVYTSLTGRPTATDASGNTYIGTA